MRNFKIITISLAMALLVSAGSVQPESASETEPAGSPDQSNTSQADALKDGVFSDINRQYQTIKPILQKSCFDCHSQQSEYPWYHKLPLIGSMIDDHIKEGREHLDLSNDFPFTGSESLLKLLEDMKEEIAEEEMPLWSYRLMHWGTLIEGAQRDSVLGWIDRASTAIGPFSSDEQESTEAGEKEDN